MPEGGFSFSHKKGQTFVPYNGKIADITHADTNLHTLTLANAAGTGAIASETRKIIGLLIDPYRISGTGVFHVFPNSGAKDESCSSGQFMYGIIVIANNTQTLTYHLTVANDDFDLYCLGYVVEN